MQRNGTDVVMLETPPSTANTTDIAKKNTKTKLQKPNMKDQQPYSYLMSKNAIVHMCGKYPVPESTKPTKDAAFPIRAAGKPL